MLTRASRLRLISAATDCVSQGTLTAGESIIVPIDDQAELACMIRAVGACDDGNPVSPYLFTDFELIVLREHVKTGKLTAKQTATRIRFEDTDGSIVNGLDASGEVKAKVKMTLARLKELKILQDEGASYFSVVPEVINLVPTLASAAKKDNSDSD